MRRPSKFSQSERREVIERLQVALGVALRLIGSRSKYLEDENGRRYLLLGGYGNWHGIPKDVVETEERSKTQGTLLVVAKRYEDRMEVYSGPLAPLLRAKDKLTITKKDRQYEFTVHVKNGQMTVRKVPEVVLTPLASSQDRVSVHLACAKLAELVDILTQLTTEERSSLVQRLRRLGKG